MIEIKDNEDFNRAFQTPESFKNELREYCQTISAGLDTKSARELSIHKIGSPVLQLLVQFEGLVDRERTFGILYFVKIWKAKILLKNHLLNIYYLIQLDLISWNLLLKMMVLVLNI